MKIYIKDVYKKIVEQSKKKFFYDVFFVPNKTDSLIEVFQLNLIVVLWYMKKKEFDQKDITLLIPRKMRKLTENFYGRLYSYSIQFDKISEKKDCQLIKKLKSNFNEEKINYVKYSRYLQKNINYLCKTEKKDFQKLTFF